MSTQVVDMRGTRTRMGRLAVAAVVAAALAWAGRAEAQVAYNTSSPWAQVGTATTTSPVSGTFAKPTTGTSRIILVAVLAEYSVAATTFSNPPVVTYGSTTPQTATRITSVDVSSRQKIWIGYLTEAQITAAGGTATLSATLTTTSLTQSALYAAVFNGVNQTTVTNGSAATGSDTTATAMSPGSVAWLANGMSVYVSNANSAAALNATPVAAYTERVADTLVNAQFVVSAGEAARATASSATDTVTLATAARYAVANVALNPAAAAGTLTLGDGTAPANATICAAPAVATFIDHFTMLASAATNVNTVTTTFNASPAGLLSSLEVTDDAGTLQSPALANPSGLNPAVTGLTFAAPTGAAAQYRLRVTPTATATTSGSFTARVTGVTTSGGFTLAGSDAASATIIVDGQASPDATGASATPTSGTVTASWTNPAAGTVPGTDFGSYVVVLGSTATISDVPAKGTATYTVGAAVGASTVVCVGNVATCPWTGRAASTPYFLKIFTRDGCSNWSAGVQVTATTPAGGDVTPPLNVTLNSTSATGLDATLNWTNPAADFLHTLVLRQPGAAVTAVPVTGTTYTVGGTIGSSTVLLLDATANPTATSWTNTLPAAGTYTYKLFSRDAAGNYASGVSTTVTVPVAGSSNPAAPMVAIVSPQKGGVVSGGTAGKFRVQIRVFNPAGFASLTSLALSTNGGSTFGAALALTPQVSPADGARVGYDSGTTGRTYETQLSLAPGAYVLVARAANAVPLTAYSEPVSVTVNDLGVGDSHLLVRDNSSQLCADCHTGIQSHSSESSSTAHGIWSTTCRDCHTPHTTRNVYLVKEQITPPSRDGVAQAPKAVYFANAATGNSNVAGATTPGSSSYSNNDFTGPCQVCHTQTTRYRASGFVGTETSDHTGRCADCHQHTKGFGASCSSCHNSPPTVPASGGHSLHDQTTVKPSSYVASGTYSTATQYGFACGKCHAGTHQNSAGLGTLASPWIVEVKGDLAWNAAATVFTAGGTVNTDNLASPGQYFRYTNGTCASFYCHSDGKAVPAYKTTPAWGAAPTGACTLCHDSAAAATTLSVNHLKHVNTTTYAYDCFKCHAGTVNAGKTIKDKTLHVNKLREVAFDASAAPSNPSPAGYAAPTCSSVYCHSNGYAAGLVYQASALTWGGAATACTTCHASGTSIATGSHAVHVNNAGTGSYTCSRCHSGTTADNATIAAAGFAKHVNGTPDLDAGTGFALATHSCSGVMCHNSGQATPVNYPVLWGIDVIGCGDCHGAYQAPDLNFGFVSKAGEPNYLSGGQATPTANSHGKHVGSAADCVSCHVTTVNAAGTAILTPPGLHLNGTRNVAILLAYDTNAGTREDNYAPATKTCSSVSCHGSGTPVWGGTALKCSDCHTGAADVDSFAFGTAGVINTTEWTGSGHGQATFGANTLPTIAAGQPCLYCHDGSVTHATATNPFRLNGASGALGALTPGSYNAATNNGNAVCLNCHGTGSTGVNAAAQGVRTSIKKIDSWHAGAKHTTSVGGRRCWDCHDPHGDGNIRMIGKKVVRTSADNYSFSATRVPAAGTLAFTANAVGTDYANATGTGVCNVCHLTALHYTASAGDGHQSGAACVKCHVHDNLAPANGFQQGTACNACHNSPPTVGNHTKHIAAIQAAPVYGSTTIGSTGVTYGYQCGVCHTTVAANHVNDIGGTAADPYNVNVTFSMGPVTTYAQGATPVTETGPTGLIFRGTNGSCATAYCHDPQGALYTGTAVTWTQAPGALACTACHAMGGAATTALPNAHPKHVTTAAGSYAYGCERCHNTTTTTGNTITNTTQHAVNSHNVAFNSVPVNQTAGTYTVGSLGSCGATYCHSGGVAVGAPFSATASAALAWTGTATCRSCHGWDAAAAPTIGVAAGSSFQGSANHLGHVANAAVIGTNYFCGDCHASVVAAGTNSPVTTVANHVNGTKNVSIANRGTFASTDTTATCSNTYCHSSGQATPTYRTIAWTAAVIGCNGCHGTLTGVAGAPDYASGAAGSATANSHAKHVGSAADCATCHQGTVTPAGTAISGALHTNGLREVVFNTAKAGASALYTPGTKTCSSVSCHGAGAPQWGGAALSCKSCHSTTGVETEDLGANFWANGVTATINDTQWLYSGHGKIAGTYDVTLNPAAAFSTTVTGLTECLYCHDSGVSHGVATNPFRLKGVSLSGGATFSAYSAATDPNAPCKSCHFTGDFGVDPDGAGAALLKNGTRLADAAHDGTKHTVGTLGGKFCWDCHEPHGDRSALVTTAGENIAMIRAAVIQQGDGTYGYLGAAGITRPVTYNVQTASPPAVGKIVETTTAVGTAHVGLCQACHGAGADANWTKYWNRNGQDDADGPGPGAAVASAHNSGSATTPYCVSCHPHASKFAGAGACTDCHASQQGTRRPIVSEFAGAWSHKRSAAGVVTKFDCVVCHMEGNLTTADVDPAFHLGLPGGNINLRDPDTGVEITNVAFTAAAGASPGSYAPAAGSPAFTVFSRNLASTTLEAPVQAIMINQCLHCHDANGALAAFVPGGSATKPFATTIAGAAYTGAGVTAGGVAGGVTDVSASFATTNSSYHPVLGQQNNWYAKLTRMVAPWNAATVGRGATVDATSWGWRLSCWDCHALPTDTGTITRTVTAHGAASTLRGTVTVTGTPAATNQVTLCAVCHSGYLGGTVTTHGTGSALSGNTNNGMTPYLNFGCNMCHSSGYATAVARPIRAQDTHGVNALPATGTKTLRWLGTAQGTPTAVVNARPYAFIRNTSVLSDHSPAKIGVTTYSANCNMAVSPCSQGVKTYTLGGTY